ncbi:MAG: Formamidopyrimidine-DNA glycosylase [Candidatus Woesebacteria bacterium GW2011_GWA1_33_30]|uniref:Formamidopyrimidine-DNA glycosylase n=1 Tax=Candidatus Woesebacteria bacterium GW2011_GWA2_33_28 TaxID=1618561 RepID=A0A0G0CVX5_9BACT|nr:MAG: Formamidopyrimidine-DNA glycosylase [Candidatus Woesebacteria bacterium GW2011_GWA2_33_28]KKP48397.1 MAG: Formamidopyrimidine-DNA glycosylase [Candidatus Woesebacteria bacterium GW2011_GWA1_33_30]KKP49504.1 MAG: Formamidopyrimidine-DNA glycosylase [Microgenomates group bacterium GW2011_GWC1_33_32]KKP52469.1 MAG: Formamidopyrimidine-DNA glycosylase [Candidatus Woesebacteria bacterium GW2011_GWB1_33_38]KKP58327.1 MAG: Formamidopyrimidine-DNA glycosylase [Microgenomates group bacterium GW2
MPELPEVETIKLQLEKYVVGATIKDIEILSEKIFSGDKDKAIGHKIVGIRRFAKQLLIDLDNNYSIMIHVKMTGQLLYQNPKIKNQISPKVIGGLGGKHTHVIFRLNDGDLYYNDVRQFGWIRIIKSEELKINNFAPEPLKDLTLEYFTNLLFKSRRNIKVLLMDQSKIGGIGNIYANDALWLAGISPRSTANSLQPKKVKKLYNSIHTALKAGLKYGGSSESSYVTPDGQEGEYQNHTLVYGRQGKPCQTCGTKIEKFFLGGRGTYWCKICQK